MFQYLKHRLGMDALEEQMQFYHKQWIQIGVRFADMNDHLAEIKNMMENQGGSQEQKALERHTEVMARLGMVLTEVGKVVPSQTATTGFMQAFPLGEASSAKSIIGSRGRPKKVKGK